MASFIKCQFCQFFRLYTSLIPLNRSEVCLSISSVLSPQWETCKTWQQAVKLWDQACQDGTVSIVRAEIWNTSAATRHQKIKTATPHVNHGAPATPRTPKPHMDLEAPAIPRTLVSGRLAPPKPKPSSGASTLSASMKHLPEVIVISDSSSDSDIEATYPRKFLKKYDCFELTDDENGVTTVTKTYDAKTNTHLDTPTKANVPSQAKASRATSLPRTKIRAPVTVGVSGSGYESDLESPSPARLQTNGIPSSFTSTTGSTSTLPATKRVGGRKK